MRKKVNQRLGELLAEHPWLEETLPHLRRDVETSDLLRYRWTVHADRIEELL